MAPVTELATITLKPGSTIHDPSSSAGQLVQSTVDTVVSQPGAQRCFWGMKHEAANEMVLLVDWDSLDAHMAFANTPEYGPLMKSLGAICDSPPEFSHVEFDPFPPSAALKAGATAVLTTYQPASASAEDTKALESNMAQLARTTSTLASGFVASRFGHVVEKIVDPANPANGKQKAAVNMSGWESVQAHMRFSDSKECKDNMHLLTDAPKLSGTSFFHVVGVQEVMSGVGGVPSAQEEILNPQQQKVRVETVREGPPPAE
ncbi:MAG: hypothetical protein M1828_006007 [Chrysothrix sp. TS-e1954]|nr:MAG: hypothetical protein M1828_006007 [Chrysothrix sp. TS-e1954]